MTRHVSVLMGGWSSEREVSLVSGGAVARALGDAGYQVTAIDVQRDVGTLLARLFPRPDVVFNALHGRYGEDGCIQGLLNILEIPYTHSGLLASALAMDKPTAKTMFREAGIQVVEHKIVGRPDMLAGDPLPRPYVVKPRNEGSSVGVHIVNTGENAAPVDVSTWAHGLTLMAEPFIPGRELTVGVMGDRALAVTEISSERSFYDYEAKYAPGGSTHKIPAPLAESVAAEAKDIAVRAHRALGCRGVSRADFRYDGRNLYLLEINTQPGMTPTSLVPEQAAYAKISFEDLCVWMVENAEYDT
ncbi:MAG: D-alanine--D-alanine ligase [Rhodospirillales bacterium]|nr:D-alanine--D-alanine ligase [Rhodospirillales bacterium]